MSTQKLFWKHAQRGVELKPIAKLQIRRLVRAEIQIGLAVERARVAAHDGLGELRPPRRVIGRIASAADNRVEHHPVRECALPLAFPQAARIAIVERRFERPQPARVLPLRLPLHRRLPGRNQAIRRVWLIRIFHGAVSKARPHVGRRIVSRQVHTVGSRTGRKSRHSLQLVLARERHVEPQLVSNDSAAKVRVPIVEMKNRIRIGDVLRA